LFCSPRSNPLADFIDRRAFAGVKLADGFIQQTQQALFFRGRPFRLGLRIEPQLQSHPFVARKPGDGLLNFN
jgi:hypothetical protein